MNDNMISFKRARYVPEKDFSHWNYAYTINDDITPDASLYCNDTNSTYDIIYDWLLHNMDNIIGWHIRTDWDNDSGVIIQSEMDALKFEMKWCWGYNVVE